MDYHHWESAPGGRRQVHMGNLGWEGYAYTDDDARVVRRIRATQSEGRRPVVPREAGHLIRRNGAACRSVATRVVQLCLSFLPDGLVGVKSLFFRFRIDSPFRVMV